MDEDLIQLVGERAQHCCEYCQLPQLYSTLTFEIDHVIAKKHGGPTAPNNLALTCFYCNSFKGPNLSGIDPKTKRVVPLFNPRRHKWARHFRWLGPVFVGRTPNGRAAIAALKFNIDHRIAHRQALIIEGGFPPA